MPEPEMNEQQKNERLKRAEQYAKDLLHKRVVEGVAKDIESYTENMGASSSFLQMNHDVKGKHAGYQTALEIAQDMLLSTCKKNEINESIKKQAFDLESSTNFKSSFKMDKNSGRHIFADKHTCQLDLFTGFLREILPEQNRSISNLSIIELAFRIQLFDAYFYSYTETSTRSNYHKAMDYTTGSKYYEQNDLRNAIIQHLQDENTLNSLFRSSGIYQYYCQQNAGLWNRMTHVSGGVLLGGIIGGGIAYGVSAFLTSSALLTPAVSAIASFLGGFGLGIATGGLSWIIGGVIGLIALGVTAYKAYKNGLSKDIENFKDNFEKNNTQKSRNMLDSTASLNSLSGDETSEGTQPENNETIITNSESEDRSNDPQNPENEPQNNMQFN